MTHEILIDPAWLRMKQGFFSQQLSVEDEYPSLTNTSDYPSALGRILDHLMATLPEDQKTALRYQVYERLCYREIAVAMEMECGDPPYPDKKKAWRLVQRAIRSMKKLLADRPDWVEELIGEDLP